MADPASLLRRQSGVARRGRGARGARPAAGTWSSTTRPSWPSTTPGSRRHHLGGPLRRLVEEGAAADSGSADHDPGRSHHRCRRRRSRPCVPFHLDDRRLRPAGRLRLRPGQRSRRGDRAGPGVDAQPDRPRALQLAGPGVAARAGHRVDPVAAQGGAPEPGAGARVRQPGTRLAGPASGRSVGAAAGRPQPGPAKPDR